MMSNGVLNAKSLCTKGNDLLNFYANDVLDVSGSD
jgi:hypothetical protein